MPLNDPVPSDAIDVLRRNSEDIDSVVNDNGATVTTRTGREDLTLAEIQRRATSAIQSAGYNLIQDFTTGATLNNANDALLWDTANGGDGDYYRWDGSLPKTVPASSTPASTGGVGDGAWVGVGDAALRSALSNVGDDKGADIPKFQQKSSYSPIIISSSDKMSRVLNVMDFIPQSEWANIEALDTESQDSAVVTAGVLNALREARDRQSELDCNYGRFLITSLELSGFSNVLISGGQFKKDGITGNLFSVTTSSDEVYFDRVKLIGTAN
jgi:hypothetical protein